MRQFTFPNENEYHEYLAYYLEQVKEEEDILLFLQQQAQDVIKNIEGISAALLDETYAEGKWTIKELIIHLIDTERIFCTRALCFARGEQTSLPGYEQDDYVTEANARERSKESLLEEYLANRISTLAFFKGLGQKTHQIIGQANNLNVSVRSLLYAIAGHEKHHLAILKEKYL